MCGRVNSVDGGGTCRPYIRASASSGAPLQVKPQGAEGARRERGGGRGGRRRSRIRKSSAPEAKEADGRGRTRGDRVGLGGAYRVGGHGGCGLLLGLLGGLRRLRQQRLRASGGTGRGLPCDMAREASEPVHACSSSGRRWARWAHEKRMTLRVELEIGLAVVIGPVTVTEVRPRAMRLRRARAPGAGGVAKEFAFDAGRCIERQRDGKGFQTRKDRRAKGSKMARVDSMGGEWARVDSMGGPRDSWVPRGLVRACWVGSAAAPPPAPSASPPPAHAHGGAGRTSHGRCGGRATNSSRVSKQNPQNKNRVVF